MAGAHIEVDDREVLAALDELLDRIGNIDEPLRDIGKHLLNTTRERFAREVAPDGTPWAQLSDETLRRKMLRGVERGRGSSRRSLTTKSGATRAGAIRALAADKILVLDGYLYGLLRYQVSDGELALGTDRVYGATHQFGDPSRNIPARPFLGLSHTDREDVLDILREYLEEAAH